MTPEENIKPCPYCKSPCEIEEHLFEEHLGEMFTQWWVKCPASTYYGRDCGYSTGALASRAGAIKAHNATFDFLSTQLHI